MSKKHFIELADSLRYERASFVSKFGEEAFNRMVAIMADFCASQNYHFKRHRWLMYIAGECGPNGGRVKGTR